MVAFLFVFPCFASGCGAMGAIAPHVVSHAAPQLVSLFAVTAINGELASAQTEEPAEFGPEDIFQSTPGVAILVPRREYHPDAPRDFTPVDLNDGDGFVAPAPTEIPAFSQGDAHAALDVSLSACRERGLPAGYGSATITFAPDGTVSEVALHTQMSDDAQRCVRDAYDVSVPAFRGASVTVATRWFAN